MMKFRWLSVAAALAPRRDITLFTLAMEVFTCVSKADAWAAVAKLEPALRVMLIPPRARLEAPIDRTFPLGAPAMFTVTEVVVVVVDVDPEPDDPLFEPDELAEPPDDPFVSACQALPRYCPHCDPFQ